MILPGRVVYELYVWPMWSTVEYKWIWETPILETLSVLLLANLHQFDTIASHGQCDIGMWHLRYMHTPTTQP